MKNKPVNAPEAAAVIGLGCLFPEAGDTASYWSLIRGRQDAITDIPADHWSLADYYDPDPKAVDKTYGRRGGFLRPAPFEPLKFGIAPKDLPAIDTTQLLGLMAADRALEDAGYGAAGGYDHSRTAVMLGVTGALKMVAAMGGRLAQPQLRRAILASGLTEDLADEVLERFRSEFVDWQENTFPGLLGNVVAGRLANRLHLGGANLVVDAACASSLAAVRQGLLELQSGRADLVVTGGLDTFSDPFMYTCFSKTPALSPSGECRAYDQTGDGAILGEGLGVIILKRLDEARRDGDRIYAVVRTVGASSDGKMAAIFAPHPEGQARALAAAYAQAGVSPATVELVEGHGTGTAVGDSVEVTALAEVFGDAPDKSPAPWCALGSVKSQIGHTKAAAGAAGLIKAVLALHHKVLPPTIKVGKPLDILSDPQNPFYINDEARPWLARPGHPRRAGVSAFGFGGSNFHCLVEEEGAAKPEPESMVGQLLFACSGESPAALRPALAGLFEAEESALPVLARASLAAYRPDGECRLWLVAAETEARNLARRAWTVLGEAGFHGVPWPEGVFFGRGQVPAGFGLLLPDQPPAPTPALLAELALTRPEFLAELDQAALALAQKHPELPSLGLLLFPPSLASAESRRQWSELAARPEVAAAARTAFVNGIGRVLAAFGLSPALTEFWTPELARKGLAEGPGCWLDGGLAAEEAALAVRTLEAGGARLVSGRFGLAGLLAGLAAWGLPVEMSAWPELPARPGPAPDGFVVPLTGANYVPPKEARPAAVKKAAPRAAASVPAAPAASPAAALERLAAETARLHQEFLQQQAETLRLLRLAQEEAAAATPAPPRPAPESPRPDEPPADREAPPADVLELVSAETGYPLAMLKPEMDLEADLGLDSIKKVEIMAAIGERWPHLAAQSQETLARAVTLGDLLALPGGGAAPVPAAGTAEGGDSQGKLMSTGFPRGDGAKRLIEAPEPRPAGSRSPFLPDGEPSPATTGQACNENCSAEGLWPAVKAVVAAETGYPEAMLHEGMDLESDLGLDSIKRVEILAALSERLPRTAGLEADLSGGRTLGDLLRALEGSKARPPVAPNPPDPAAAASDLEATLLEVVAAETGYPAGMLRPELNLESDLGLDSIKRVEIMAALSERLPGVNLETPGSSAGPRTLGELAALLQVGFPPPPVSTPPPVSVPTVEPGRTLLEVVAAETGYPLEMLTFDLSLEGGLGLDSIKKVEILAALSERLGDEQLAVTAADLDQAVTLGDLRDLLASAGGRAAEPSPAPPAAAAAAEPAPARRTRKKKKAEAALEEEYSPVVTKRRTRGQTPGVWQLQSAPLDLDSHAVWPSVLDSGSRLWLLGGGALAAKLSELLSAQAVDVVRIDWAGPGDLAGLPRPDGLIAIWPGDNENPDLALQSLAVLRAAGRYFTAEEAKPDRPPFLLGLTFLGGAFAVPTSATRKSAPMNPVSGALAGLVKSAAREWPGLRARVIDLPLSAHGLEAHDYARGVLRAARSDGPMEIAMPRPDLFYQLELSPYEPAGAHRPLKPGDTVVVTGGGRGVTAAAVLELARRFQPHLVILGRSPIIKDEPELAALASEAELKAALFERSGGRLSPAELARETGRILNSREVSRNLKAFEEAGARVTYLTDDLRRPETLRKTLTEIIARHGPVRGFIHGAGVLADGLLVNKTDENFQLVFDTKARVGLLALSLLRSEPLALAAFFSSSSARFGRRGQSDYAASNEVLNKLAQWAARRWPKARVMAVNWGPWAGGMVTPPLARIFRREGIGLIPVEDGAALFGRLAAAPADAPCEVLVLGPGTDLAPLGLT